MEIVELFDKLLHLLQVEAQNTQTDDLDKVLKRRTIVFKQPIPDAAEWADLCWVQERRRETLLKLRTQVAEEFGGWCGGCFRAGRLTKKMKGECS